MCGFRSQLHSQILHNFDLVSHFIFTWLLFHFRFDLITESEQEL